MVYHNIPKEEVLKIYDFVMKKRKKGFGQRKLGKMIREKFGKEICETTISNWIFSGKIPFGNEKTQFKSLPKPLKEELYDSYVNKKQSAQKLASEYGVSTIIIINWLKSYEIKPRTHLESMNTEAVKNELRENKLRRPTKEFLKITPEKAYILGVLCGDGCISEKFIRLEIRNDEDFIKEFARCLKEVYGLDYPYYYYKKRDSFVLYASSEIVCLDLLKYGRCGTFEWKIPLEIFNSSKESISCSFLRGLFDSEGTTTKYVVSMSSANEKGINQVNELLNKLEIKNKIMKTKRGYYVLYITGRERLKKFKEKIGFTIKRKLMPLEYIK